MYNRESDHAQPASIGGSHPYGCTCSVHAEATRAADQKFVGEFVMRFRLYKSRVDDEVRMNREWAL